MPVAGGHLYGRALDLLAPALDHTVEVDVVLEGIRADHVVVIDVPESDCKAASSVNPARNCLEPDAHLDVLRRDGLIDCQREAVVGRVRARLLNGLAVPGRGVGNNAPLPGRAL